MSQLLPQFSSVKCPFVLCVAVTLAVGFYNYLVVEWDSEVMQQVQNQSFLLQNATQKLESVGVAREKVVLEDRSKPRVVVFWGKWFNAKWAARKGTLTRCVAFHELPVNPVTLRVLHTHRALPLGLVYTNIVYTNLGRGRFP